MGHPNRVTQKWSLSWSQFQICLNYFDALKLQSKAFFIFYWNREKSGIANLEETQKKIFFLVEIFLGAIQLRLEFWKFENFWILKSSLRLFWNFEAKVKQVLTSFIFFKKIVIFKIYFYSQYSVMMLRSRDLSGSPSKAKLLLYFIKRLTGAQVYEPIRDNLDDSRVSVLS